jgi:hypothetical protein
MHDEGLADAAPLAPFVYPDFTQELVLPPWVRAQADRAARQEWRSASSASGAA